MMTTVEMADFWGLDDQSATGCTGTRGRSLDLTGLMAQRPIKSSGTCVRVGGEDEVEVSPILEIS